jgi:hypothetical protein
MNNFVCEFKKTSSHTFNLLRGTQREDVLSRVLRFKWRKVWWEGRESAQNDERPGLPFTTKFDGKILEVEDSCEGRSLFRHQNDSRGVEYWQRNGESNRNNRFESVANPDPKVRSSGTIKCRIVYASARRGLQIRIRHWFEYEHECAQNLSRRIRVKIKRGGKEAICSTILEKIE